MFAPFSKLVLLHGVLFDDFLTERGEECLRLSALKTRIEFRSILTQF
jgi:hypothetical protein